MDETENPFLKYSSQNSKHKHKKNTTEIIDSFKFEKGKKFIYILNNSFSPFDFSLQNLNYKNVKFLIEVLKTKKPVEYELYPQVAKISKAFKETYENEILF